MDLDHLVRVACLAVSVADPDDPVSARLTASRYDPQTASTSPVGG